MLRILAKIVKESFIIAIQELLKNKLRSLLSLLGITIGILCIISVLTSVDSLRRNLKQGFESLGNDVLYIQKWPILFTNDYPWWEFFRRPEVTYEEFKRLQDELQLAEASTYMAFMRGRSVKQGVNEIKGVDITGVSHEYNLTRDLSIENGRYFSLLESEKGSPVAILGANVAENLFPTKKEIIGEKFRTSFGKELTIIGILEREGQSMIDFSLDNNILIPIMFVMEFRNVEEMGPLVAVSTKDGTPIDELKYEIQGKMRTMRKLKPREKDNFAVNEISLLTEALDNVFRIVAYAGAFIGIFAIFVGGFGIANIMFVSVKERTSIIGIKKALGAKKIYILLEFLIESVVLCLIGGIVGLLVVYGLFEIINIAISSTENTFVFTISAFYVNLGLSISIVIGLIAGFIPALMAANMKPVEAIRSA